MSPTLGAARLGRLPSVRVSRAARCRPAPRSGPLSGGLRYASARRLHVCETLADHSVRVRVGRSSRQVRATTPPDLRHNSDGPQRGFSIADSAAALRKSMD